jgi:hypothetical protein
LTTLSPRDGFAQIERRTRNEDYQRVEWTSPKTNMLRVRKTGHVLKTGNLI